MGGGFGYQASVQVCVQRERELPWVKRARKKRGRLVEGRDSTVFFCASIPSDRQTRTLEYKCTHQMWLLISDLVMLAFGCESVPPRK